VLGEEKREVKNMVYHGPLQFIHQAQFQHESKRGGERKYRGPWSAPAFTAIPTWEQLNSTPPVSPTPLQIIEMNAHAAKKPKQAFITQYCKDKYGPGTLPNVDPLMFDEKGTCNPAYNSSCSDRLARTRSPFPTCVTDINGDCKGSYLADFGAEGGPEGAGIVCYEAAPWAPWGSYGDSDNYTMGYLQFMLRVNTDPGEPVAASMYQKAKIDWTRSCGERGFHYNKLVHPCFQHGYSVYISHEKQDEYEKYRDELFNPGRKHGDWNVTTYMVTGGCNQCQ
jgi:hypothetical protein